MGQASAFKNKKVLKLFNNYYIFALLLIATVTLCKKKVSLEEKVPILKKLQHYVKRLNYILEAMAEYFRMFSSKSVFGQMLQTPRMDGTKQVCWCERV